MVTAVLTPRIAQVVIIAQHTADGIRHAVKAYSDSGKVIPTVLEVPTKDHPSRGERLGRGRAVRLGCC